MSRVKLSNFVSKINYDKCLNSSVNSNSLINQFATNSRDRSSIQSRCDSLSKKKYSKIFEDISNSIKKIQTEKIGEEGDILTNKLEGTTSNSRKHDNNIDMNNEIDQSGSGRKRKYKRHETMESGHPKRKKRKYVKKRKNVKKRKTSKRKHRKRGATKRSQKKKKKSKHHFRRHNIFSSTD
jgi:hypothetical protein